VGTNTYYPVDAVAGSWCYSSPALCGSNPTCDCLMAHGAFAPVADGGLGLLCPGSYWQCFDFGGDGGLELHCNPP
jgi:hypothetical protein